MRCRQAMVVVHNLLDDRRPLSESPELMEHLDACDRCSKEVADLAALSQLVADRPEAGPVPVERIKARVMEEIIADRHRRERPRRALSPALAAAVGSAAVITVFAIGIFVGRGTAPQPGAPASEPGGSSGRTIPMIGGGTAAGPSLSLDAPVFTMGSEDDGGKQAVPMDDAPAEDTVERSADGSTPTVADARPSRAAANRRPIVPRGRSVRSPSERLTYTTTEVPRAPEEQPRAKSTPEVRSYEVEVPELQMPTPSSPKGGGDGGDSGAKIILIVPGQEF